MTAFYFLAQLGCLSLICVCILLELARKAPLVDENEQLIEDDKPRELPIAREEFQQ